MPRLHVPMKRRPSPLARVCDISVLDRIKMNVVEAGLQILVVADDVLMIAPLPDASMAPLSLRCCQRFLMSPCRKPSRRELVFDVLPACGVCVVTRRQDPQAMEVIPQQNRREQFKWLHPQDFAKRIPHQFSCKSIAKQWIAVAGDNREELCPARNKPSPIVRHDGDSFWQQKSESMLV